MIPLEHDRARLTFIAVQGTAGDTRDNLVADDRPSIGNNRYLSPYQRNIIGLPFPGCFGHLVAGFDKSIDRAEEIFQGGIAKIIGDLHFIALLLPLG